MDRCGREVHYVIDYYDGGPVDPSTNRFSLLDVRPAVDSPGNVYDRMTAFYWRKRLDWFGKAPSLPMAKAVDNEKQATVAH